MGINCLDYFYLRCIEVVFLLHLLNDFRKGFLGEQAFDGFFMALPFLYWDRTAFGGIAEQ